MFVCLVKDGLNLDLKKWNKEDLVKGLITTEQCMDKLSMEKKIDIFDDLIDELSDLKGKSYAVSYKPGSPQGAEREIKCNLSVLLSSNYYHSVILPIAPEGNKTSFCYKWGLSKNAGCRLGFEDFLNLVRQGKLKIVLSGNPARYDHTFEKEIFDACEENGYRPPYVWFRVNTLMRKIKMEELRRRDNIPEEPDWYLTVDELHPEYFRPEFHMRKLLMLFGQDGLHEIADREGVSSEKTLHLAVSRFGALMGFGLENLADLTLECMQIDPVFGYGVLEAYVAYLIHPMSLGLLGNTNYGLRDVLLMAFTQIVPKDLTQIWEDMLTSAPASSSIVSPSLEMNTVELDGKELLRLIDDHPEEELKQNVKKLNESLSELDLRIASKTYEKVDEIVTERYNSVLRDLSKKERLTKVGVRFGEYIAAGTEIFSSALTSIKAMETEFEWLIGLIAAQAGLLWFTRKVSKISPKKIVKWWTNFWPFTHSGLPFVLWEHGIENLKRNKKRDHLDFAS